MKELRVIDFKYQVWYCRPSNYKNNDCLHYEPCNTLQDVEIIINWCIENNLIIKAIKAVRI